MILILRFSLMNSLLCISLRILGTMMNLMIKWLYLLNGQEAGLSSQKSWVRISVGSPKATGWNKNSGQRIRIVTLLNNSEKELCSSVKMIVANIICNPILPTRRTWSSLKIQQYSVCIRILAIMGLPRGAMERKNFDLLRWFIGRARRLKSTSYWFESNTE